MQRSKAATSWHHWLYWAAVHEDEFVLGPNTLRRSFENAKARRSPSSSAIGSLEGSGTKAMGGLLLGRLDATLDGFEVGDQLGIAVKQHVHADRGVEDLGRKPELAGQVRRHRFQRRARVTPARGRAQEPPVDHLSQIADFGIGPTMIGPHDFLSSRLARSCKISNVRCFRSFRCFGEFFAALKQTQDRMPDAERLHAPPAPLESKECDHLGSRGDRPPESARSPRGSVPRRWAGRGRPWRWTNSAMWTGCRARGDGHGREVSRPASANGSALRSELGRRPQDEVAVMTKFGAGDFQGLVLLQGGQDRLRDGSEQIPDLGALDHADFVVR